VIGIRPGEVAVRVQHRCLRFSRHETFRIVHAVLPSEGVYVGSISVAYVDDRRMRSLNARYLDHRWTTDVLAFSYTTSGAVDGEVVVNLDQARRQAPHFGVRYGDEVRRLLVHGLLHLAGHVDDTPSRRDRMRRREDRYLASLTTRHARTNR